ncbi:biotin--[acetyl-CoA-carboxylase] ligase [Fontisphaera persica]|uniref:biotin--[acetyl-CoA-carboxylase] ligase n=1 Tax=Fontisphaera persica TaxID=2974023 RepID=UPI0024BF5FA6|nr:biotin--[acetyl-CoA-carboxylase] ligase [Fontisphaera persica]WCJ58975.1 biotin--[acetyl-CoA-carboxylase] ligase [Fontisphaera persica]
MSRSDSALDTAILTALRQAQEGSVSGADLAARLKVTRAAIWARIEALRALGFDIEASPHHGYRLLSAPDRLYGDDLKSRLGSTRIIGRDIRVFQETNSTNDLADRLARDGAEEGVVVFAEKQSRGRGRMGRAWASPPGLGLWFSVVLRPRLTPQSATQLTIAAATAARRAIHRVTGLEPDIKWPNDLLLDGRKTAGILTEMGAELDKIKYLIIGIGVNVNLAEADFPPELRRVATSLRQVLGRPIPRPELAAELLRELDTDYARVTSGHFDAVAEEWSRHCRTLGQRVVILQGERRIEGRAEGLDHDGALLLRNPRGRLERIIGGDVMLGS